MNKSTFEQQKNKIILIFILGIACWWILFSLSLKKHPTIDYVNDTPSKILNAYNKNGLSKLNSWYNDREELDFAVKYIGRKFPNIDLKTVSGKHITNEYFKDKKTLIIIGASYCENCQDVSKAINGLYNNDIQLLYIYPKDNLADMIKYYEKINIALPNDKLIIGSQNTTMSITKDLSVKAVPLLLYVDGNGKISYVHLGNSDKDSLNEFKDRAFSNKNAIYNELKNISLF